MNELLTMLRAAGDPTRLRLLLLLREAELTVSELTQILGQSQPRVSRHLKLLCDANLLQRFKEGSWVFYRSVDAGGRARFVDMLAAFSGADSGTVEGDRRQLATVRRSREAAAAAFFKANASDWERIRSLHAPEPEVEAAIEQLVHAGKCEALLDAGTGTGRILELLARDVRHGVGIDVSPEMLAIARDRLERAGAHHCQVRLADMYRLPYPVGNVEQGFDVAIFHQVLHYCDDPEAAVVEAARVLRPEGRILIVDFAPHELEFLRSELAHRRLGFADEEVRGWFVCAGLKPVASRSIAPETTKGEAGKLTVKIWVGAMAELPLSARKKVAA
jgi:ubiquinone/menaquinone biosynthesis C-methylase UbiE